MLRKFFSFVVLTITALFAGHLDVNATAEVKAELLEATTSSITIRFTPNSEVKEFYVCQFDHDGLESTFEEFKGMFGLQSIPDMIQKWGVKNTGIYANEWKKLAPNTPYDFCIAVYDKSGQVAPVQTYTFSTARKGGDGASVIKIDIKEAGDQNIVDATTGQVVGTTYVQRIVCTANDQTSRFYSQPWPDKWFDDEGVLHHYSAEDAKAYLLDLYNDPRTRDMYALFDVDDWKWEVEKAAKYHATAMGMNANGEWGEMTEVVFTTPGYIEQGAASLWWGYGDGQTIVATNGTSKEAPRAAALQVTEEVLAAYDGAKITDIKFAVGGDGQCTDVSYFIVKEDLKNAAANYIPVGTLKTGWHEFHLDNPVTIHQGEKVYVGYQATGKKPIAIGEDNGYTGTCYIGSGTSWADYGDASGFKLACQIKLESTNISASASVLELGELAAETNKPIVVKGKLQTLTPVPVTSYTVALSVDGVQMGTASGTCNLDAAGATDAFVITTSRGVAAGEHTYAISILKLNGETPKNAVVREGKLIVKDVFLTRRHVFEDGTGTWCGYCPRAMLGIEWMKKAHPDEVIALGVHAQDAYEVPSSEGIRKKFSGYPTVLINRGDKCGGGSSGDLESYFQKECKKEIEAETIIVAAEWTDASHTTVALILRDRFAADYAEHGFAHSFAVIEDDIYAYQGSNIAEFPSGMTYLQDVVRCYDNYYGIANSVPAQLTMGEKYYYRYDLRLPTNVANKSKAHVVALLTKNNANAIVNADIVHVPNIDEPGTNDLTGIGTVLRDGVAPVAESYDLQGRRIAAPQRGQISIQNGRKVIGL
ncbi:MAG: thioredoxin family protein [Bacteroidales bacterium]|nr:thioredoxin family protein [Bacteroidales bacterium]